MAHTRSALLKARLALVRRDLEEIVDRLTPDLLEWAPAEGMRTVSGQHVGQLTSYLWARGDDPYRW